MQPLFPVLLALAGCFQIDPGELDEDGRQPLADSGPVGGGSGDSGGGAGAREQLFEGPVDNETGFPEFTTARDDTWIEIQAWDIHESVNFLTVDVFAQDTGDASLMLCCGALHTHVTVPDDRAFTAYAWLERAQTYRLYISALPEDEASGELTIYSVAPADVPEGWAACEDGVVDPACEADEWLATQ